jgi:transcriptional regulator
MAQSVLVSEDDSETDVDNANAAPQLVSTVERRAACGAAQPTMGICFRERSTCSSSNPWQLGPMHGWGIAERVEQGSQNVLGVNQGSLYPALYRLEKQGFVRSEWRMTEKSRRARYYTITPAGRRQLATERAEWERLSSAVNQVLRMSEG